MEVFSLLVLQISALISRQQFIRASARNANYSYNGTLVLRGSTVLRKLIYIEENVSNLSETSLYNEGYVLNWFHILAYDKQLVGGCKSITSNPNSQLILILLDQK